MVSCEYCKLVEHHGFTCEPMPGEESKGHIGKCNTCGLEMKGMETHIWNNVCGEKKFCIACDYCCGVVEHDFVWVEYGEKGHIQKCTNKGCNEVGEVEKHYGGNATCTEPAKCKVCGYTYSNKIEHKWKLTWDVSTHMQICEMCKKETNKQQHYGGIATCYNRAICDFCKQPYGELAHNWSYKKNNVGDLQHTKYCNNCNESQEENHDYSRKYTEGKQSYKQCECGAKMKIRGNISDQTVDYENNTYSLLGQALFNNRCTHELTIVKMSDSVHWRECLECGTVTENDLKHTLSKATNNGGTTGTHSFKCIYEGCEYQRIEAHTFDGDGKCKVPDCEAIRNTECEHDFSGETGNDGEKHWKKCKKCGEIKEGTKEEHTLLNYKDNTNGTHSAPCTYEGCKHKKTDKCEFDDNGKCKKCLSKACDLKRHNYIVRKWNSEEHWYECEWCGDANYNSVEEHKLQGDKCTSEECKYVLSANNNDNVKSTIINKDIPYAGFKDYIILIILIICGAAGIFYIRYNKVKNI